MLFQGGRQGDRIMALGVRHTWDQNPVLSLTDQVTLGRNVLFYSPSLTCKVGLTALSWGCGKNWELPNINKVPGPLPTLSKWKPLNGFNLQLTDTSKCLCAQAPICVLRTPQDIGVTGTLAFLISSHGKHVGIVVWCSVRRLPSVPPF